MGGIAGMGISIGGSVEYQMSSDPHFHGNLHVASIYQHKSLVEVASMMQKNLVKLEDIAKFQSWVCREEHFDDEGGTRTH